RKAIADDAQPQVGHLPRKLLKRGADQVEVGEVSRLSDPDESVPGPRDVGRVPRDVHRRRNEYDAARPALRLAREDRTSRDDQIGRAARRGELAPAKERIVRRFARTVRLSEIDRVVEV